MNGILLINKPKNISSHDVVYKVRKAFNTRKVGHTGTLDPIATGVLPILVGNAVKASEYLTSQTKEYIATIKFGILTDTLDISGSIIRSGGKIPTKEEFINVLPTFLGESLQTPPMYSAIKVNGKKLYELAREGKTIEVEPRKIIIREISFIESLAHDTFVFKVVCSKGTYIRSLILDIAERLFCIATMSELCRTATGDFILENCISPETLKELSKEELNSLLIPTDAAFSHCKKIKLSPFYSKLAKNGAPIYFEKIKMVPDPIGELFRLYDENDVFFALASSSVYENEPVLKNSKMFLTE